MRIEVILGFLTQIIAIIIISLTKETDGKSVSFMCNPVDFKCEWGHFAYCFTRAQYCP